MSDGGVAAGFDATTLALLDRRRLVRIETTRPDGSRRRTTIWIVVDGEDVFVRSVRGERGRWYQAALDRPAEVFLSAGGERLIVRAVPAVDDRSVERCSTALERKYAGDPAVASMLRSHTLGTTLRLEPR